MRVFIHRRCWSQMRPRVIFGHMANKKRILLIEDSPEFAETMASALTEAGYEVSTAFDGETGVEMFKKSNADLVILDLILPKGDGFQVLKEIKQEPLVAAKPCVIVLTNLDSPLAVDRALQLGANAYMVKTFQNTDEIVRKSKEMIPIA